MPNGYSSTSRPRFNYESPVDRLLNYTIPTFLNQERDRQVNEERFDLLRDDRLDEREYEKKKYDEQVSRDALRYDKEWKEKEDDEQYLRGSEILKDIRIAYPNINKQLEAFKGIKLSNLHPEAATRIQSHMDALETGVADVTTKMNQFDSNIYSEQDRERIQASFMQGQDGYNLADTILRNRYSTPYIQVQSSNIGRELTVLYKDRSEAQKILSVTSGDKERDKIQLGLNAIQSRINDKETQLNNLFDMDRPFDRTEFSRSFSIDLKSSLKEAGIKVDDDDLYAKIVGAGGRYAKELQDFNEKFVTGINAKERTKEERDAAVLQIKNLIIEGEKQGPPLPKDDDEGWADMVPSMGQVGAGYLAWQLTKEPIKNAGKFLADKSVAAGKHIQWVSKLPGKDIVKFLDKMALNTPATPGAMMPKVEKLLDKIDAHNDEFSGKRKTQKYKAKLKRLNQELTDQVKKIKNRFRGLGLSKMKDADLDRLIRNPNKWRLVGVKGRMINLVPKATGAVRGWGLISAASRIGREIGDPTGGVLTAGGAVGAWKLAKKIYKKKGPKWFVNKLTPILGKSLAVKVGASAGAGAVGGPGGALAGTIIGVGATAWDIYDIVQMLKEEAEKEE